MHVPSCLERFSKHVGREAEHAVLIRQLLEDGFGVCPDPDTDARSYVFCDDEITADNLVGIVIGEPDAIIAKTEDFPW